MAKSQVETVARAAYLEDWRQTSTKTSLTTSSANVSSRTSRRTKRYTRTRCRANKLRMASLSPRAIRLTSVSSDSAWAAIDPEAGAAQPVDVKVALMGKPSPTVPRVGTAPPGKGSGTVERFLPCACRKPKSGHIGDVAHQPGRATRCVRFADPAERPAHPGSTTGPSGPN